MTTVYLIRHAESEGNFLRICQGHSDELLSPLGIRQAAALGKRFEHVPLAAVYTSDLYRAAATALAVAQPHQLPLRGDRALREIHLGAFEGRSWGDVYHQYPELRNESLTARDRPEQEKREDVARRMSACMTALALRHDGEAVAVVSHGGAISAFLEAALRDYPHTLSGNTGVVTLAYDRGWQLTAPADLSHLDAAGIPAEPLFGRDITDLWFDDVKAGRDDETVARIGRDAWKTVFGNLRDYRPDFFFTNASRLIGRPGLASLCMDDDKIAGMLLLDADRTDEPGIGHISLVYLEPEYRYRGLGRQLIGHATVQYRELGRSTLRLNVSQRNKTAIRFYQSVGFSFASRSLSDDRIMKKNIEVPKLL